MKLLFSGDSIIRRKLKKRLLMKRSKKMRRNKERL
jgi:hypothetical protein